MAENTKRERKQSSRRAYRPPGLREVPVGRPADLLMCTAPQVDCAPTCGFTCCANPGECIGGCC